MTQTRFPIGLYGVTPEWDDTARLLDAVRQAAAGGMRALQLRRKHLSRAQRLAQARELAPLCRELGVVFLVNDDWQTALEAGADGAHLGREDASLAEVRAAAPGLILWRVLLCGPGTRARPDGPGRRLHRLRRGLPLAHQAPSRARAAGPAGRGGRPGARPGRAAAGRGGHRGHHAGQCRQAAAAGADSIAVITGLFEAPDIRAAAQACAAPFPSFLA